MRRGRKLRLRNSRVGVQGGAGVCCTLPGVTSGCSSAALLLAANEDAALPSTASAAAGADVLACL